MNDNKPPVTPRTRAKSYRELISDRRIGNGAKVLWHCLYHQTNQATSECWPGYRTIVDVMGCDVHSIRGWLEELSDAGWLMFKTRHSKEHKRGYGHHYRLLDGHGEPFF